MTINATDIKLLASERMADTPDGGGRRTANVILDGVAGNIFPKVSRLDGVYGRVNLRKIFPAVQTANTDVYAGAHAVITDAPDNDRIHVCLFSTASDFDGRAEARDRIESYVIAGPESRMTLYGRQLVGQQAFTVFQRVEEPLPDIGEVFCLSNEIAGVVSAQQFVRIDDLVHEVRTFTDDTGEFTRRVLTLSMSATLRYEFMGLENVARLSSTIRTAFVRRTTVADAARYYGIKRVSEAAAPGALELKLESIYTPIVPTTQRETGVSSAEIAQALSIIPASSEKLPYHDITAPLPASGVSTTTTITLGTTVVPGSLSVRLSNYALAFRHYTSPLTDDGEGVIPGQAAMEGYGFRILGGTVDYATGLIVLEWHGQGQGDMVISAEYIRGVEVTQPSHQVELPITLSTRGTVYVQTLSPIPSPGTTYVDFRALGRWYRLRDDGLGELNGDDPAYGTGTINYITGGLIVTFGALPDVGSSVLMGWGSKVHYTIQAGVTADTGATVFQTIQLTDLPVKPGSVSLSYLGDVTTYTATEIAGVISGGGVTGTVNHASGLVELEYTTRLPNIGTSVTVNYSQETPTNPAAPTSVAGSIPVSDPTSIPLGTAIAPGGLSMSAFVMDTLWNGHRLVRLFSNAAGNVITVDQYLEINGVWLHIIGGQVVGTVNHATGLVALTSGVQVQQPSYVSTNTTSGYISAWGYVTSVWDFSIETYTYAIRTPAASSDSAKSRTADPQTDSPLYVDLTRTLTHKVVPGSVRFTVAGKTHVDRNGVLYTDVQPDGTGTASGTIDYGTGRAQLTSWASNTALGIAVQSCLTQWGDWTTFAAAFRTAGSPLRPASTYVQVTAVDGDVLTATADANGELVGTYARGTVNQEMGVVSIEWGAMVTAAGRELEPWYDAADIVGGLIWEPREVFPSTIRYNTVVLSNLPLNADILGLDPVRLPSDGRVPIYRSADVVLIHNTKDYALPNPAVAGAVYNVGRTSLSELWLIDAAGARVPTNHYVPNLAAGTVTMDAALNLTGVTQPLKARHRIEELNLLSDVQINGQMSLTGPLTRAFDVDTYVSGALLFGDMFARVANVFDQVTWTSVWSNARIGSNATAEYNSVDYPVLVVNNGALNERWRVNFTSATAFQLIGENLGVIATGTTAADLAPVNALTGLPYFTLRAAGWGAGWSVGNQLRFNTIGATAPVWIARTVLPGATLSGDSLDLQLRGDVDA